jgi:hypothetical protein
MIDLFNKRFGKEELQKYIGCISTIADAVQYRYEDGKKDGVRAIDIKTGSGLRYTVLPDRGMDIAYTEYCGMPISWVSKTGIVSPKYFEPAGYNFLRSFTGGLITTCGLTNAGIPCKDKGVLFEDDMGLHGRISNTPAENIIIDKYWEGSDYFLEIKGKVRQSSVYEENLVLKRTIKSKLGGLKISLKDEITNEGFNKSPLMLIYHINFGFPIISNKSSLYHDFQEVIPSNDFARSGSGIYDRFPAPTNGYLPDNFQFIGPRNEENTCIGIINNSMKTGVYIKYSPKELPFLTEWIMAGEQDYVVGIEPGNALPEGRSSARESGRLQYLGPGEIKEINLEIKVLNNDSNIDIFLENFDKK